MGLNLMAAAIIDIFQRADAEMDDYSEKTSTPSTVDSKSTKSSKKTLPEKDPRQTLNLAPNFDVNQYITKKTVTQGMMDVALLMSNTSQLKVLLQVGHRYYILMMGLVVSSIVLQCLAGAMFILLGKTNIRHDHKQMKADKMNNMVTVIVFFVTVVNIFIGAFGISASEGAPAESDEDTFDAPPKSAWGATTTSSW